VNNQKLNNVLIPNEVRNQGSASKASRFFKDPNTNWKYIAIVVVVGLVALTGILAYQNFCPTSEEIVLLETPGEKTPEETPEAPEQPQISASWKTYKNEEYGFEVIIPDSWKGYLILEETWNGVTLDGKSTKFQGPEIIIRHPEWTTEQLWQDVPIMVFTKNEWKLIEANSLNVSAAPIGPSKLGENQKYVFALPPRWVGFYDALGQEEAVEITKTFIVE